MLADLEGDWRAHVTADLEDDARVLRETFKPDDGDDEWAEE